MSLNIIDKLLELQKEISTVVIDIDTNIISKNLDILNYIILNKPLNIKYHTNLLTSIPNNSNNICNKCNKKANYMYKSVYICWNCSL
jgi:hypothetical protein